MANAIVLPKGALAAENEIDRAAVGRIKGIGLNLATLLRETLYLLQDGITIELHARDSRMIQVLSEQKINMEQLSL